MKKKTLVALLAAMTVAATSCGTEVKIEDTVALESSIEIMEDTGLIVFEELPTVSEMVEPIYVEYEDMFMAENAYELGKEKLEAVDKSSMEKTFVSNILLPESVDVYDELGFWVGYSKPNVEVTLLKQNKKWVEVSFIRTLFYIPKDIFDSVANADMLLAEVEEPETKQEETSKPVTKPTETKPAEVTVPVTDPEATEPAVVPEPETVVVENTKYTPEEAVAVYRSIMEANGIIWDPSIKSFASWGTGWIYLEKGRPEKAANSNASVYHEGGGDITHPWTRYYLEVTGSDANAVYITSWACD